MGTHELIETMQIQLLEGCSFSPQISNEEEKIIFNQAAMETIGLKDPLGAKIKFWGEEKTIIGIAENFHFESFYENIRPAVILLEPNHTMNMLVRIEAGKEQEALAGLQNFYKEFNPGYPFNYKFLDQEYQQLYEAEQKVSAISRYFAALAILISCLGLFGLAAHTAERRIKEIGIRKILGASVFGIVGLLSADFTKMVMLAIILALPFSIYFGQQWLNNFAFSIELQWWYFAMAGLLALVIAWLTVGFQTFKAARVNPTQCLKEE
jgi:ABC-type antimicrobial peptide transport system permease subunit